MGRGVERVEGVATERRGDIENLVRPRNTWTVSLPWPLSWFLCWLFTPTSCGCTWPLSCGAPVSLSTFPRPWRAQPCFHTLQHGGTRDPARSAHAMTLAVVRPLRLLVGAKWAAPPPRIQRRLTREPHVTEVGQCWAESRRVYLTRLSVLPHFPDAPPRGLSSFCGGTTAWRLINADLSTSFTLTKTKKKRGGNRIECNFWVL